MSGETACGIKNSIAIVVNPSSYGETLQRALSIYKVEIVPDTTTLLKALVASRQPPWDLVVCSADATVPTDLAVTFASKKSSSRSPAHSPPAARALATAIRDIDSLRTLPLIVVAPSASSGDIRDSKLHCGVLSSELLKEPVDEQKLWAKLKEILLDVWFVNPPARSGRSSSSDIAKEITALRAHAGRLEIELAQQRAANSEQARSLTTLRARLQRAGKGGLSLVGHHASKSVETPIQSVTSKLQSLVADDQLDRALRDELTTVLDALSRGNLYQVKQDESQFDSVTRSWLMAEHAFNGTSTPAKSHIRRSVRRPQRSPRAERSRSTTGHMKLPSAGASSNSSNSSLSNCGVGAVATSRSTTGSVAHRVASRSASSGAGSSAVSCASLDQDLASLSFSPFAYTEPQLIPLIHDIFASYNLLQRFSIHPDRLSSLSRAIRARYRRNPYHNFKHGFDVLQTLHTLLNRSNAGSMFSSVELLAMLIAALCHDVDHPGTNNAFEINNKTKLALLHNDKSVLENHHAVTTFLTLQESDNNVLANLTDEEYRETRAVIIASILATDMAHHFEVLAKFEGRVKTQFDHKNKQDRELLQQVLIKCSDISNVCKPFPIAYEWSIKLGREFFSQGDMEKKLGHAVAPFMDREKTNAAKTTCNFIDFMARPLFDCLATLLTDTADITESLRTNYAEFKIMEEQAEKDPAVQEKLRLAVAAGEHSDDDLDDDDDLDGSSLSSEDECAAVETVGRSVALHVRTDVDTSLVDTSIDSPTICVQAPNKGSEAPQHRGSIARITPRTSAASLLDLEEDLAKTLPPRRKSIDVKRAEKSASPTPNAAGPSFLLSEH